MALFEAFEATITFGVLARVTGYSGALVSSASRVTAGLPGAEPVAPDAELFPAILTMTGSRTTAGMEPSP